MAFLVTKVLMEDVQDMDSLLAAMDKEGFGADDIVGIAAKTEGNGGVNDFGRVLVDHLLREFFIEHGSRTMEQAMEEAEEAANRVLGGESTVKLTPQRPYIRRLQHLLGQRYNVASVSQGREPERAVMFYRV